MPYFDLLRSIKNGDVDIAFLLEESVQVAGIDTARLTAEPLHLVVSPEHPLAQCERISLSDFNGAYFLLTTEGCSYRMIFERALATAGILPTMRMEFDSVEAIKQCVMANVGIAILPDVAVQQETKTGRLVQLMCTDFNPCVYTHMLLSIA